jgi:hypothetical protein
VLGAAQPPVGQGASVAVRDGISASGVRCLQYFRPSVPHWLEEGSDLVGLALEQRVAAAAVDKMRDAVTGCGKDH